jgi:hypothetical protein
MFKEQKGLYQVAEKPLARTGIDLILWWRSAGM